MVEGLVLLEREKQAVVEQLIAAIALALDQRSGAACVAQAVPQSEGGEQHDAPDEQGHVALFALPAQFLLVGQVALVPLSCVGEAVGDLPVLELPLQVTPIYPTQEESNANCRHRGQRPCGQLPGPQAG